MMRITPIDCQPLVFCRTTMLLFEHEMRVKDIEHEFIVERGYDDLDTVSVDPQRVTQILINLLSNAIKVCALLSIVDPASRATI